MIDPNVPKKKLPNQFITGRNIARILLASSAIAVATAPSTEAAPIQGKLAKVAALTQERVVDCKPGVDKFNGSVDIKVKPGTQLKIRNPYLVRLNGNGELPPSKDNVNNSDTNYAVGFEDRDTPEGSVVLYPIKKDMTFIPSMVAKEYIQRDVCFGQNPDGILNTNEAFTLENGYKQPLLDPQGNFEHLAEASVVSTTPVSL
jgi:hypothetical protein